MRVNLDFWPGMPWWAWALFIAVVAFLSIWGSIKVVRLRDRLISAPDRLADKVAARVLAGTPPSVDKVTKG